MGANARSHAEYDQRVTAAQDGPRLLKLFLDRITDEPSASNIDESRGSFGWLSPGPAHGETPLRVILSSSGLEASYWAYAADGTEMMSADSHDEGFIRALMQDLDERTAAGQPRSILMNDNGDFVEAP
jgi:hypothetical protein